MSTLPYVRSRTNGIKIPLSPAHRGILHRFDDPQSRLVVAATHPGTAPAAVNANAEANLSSHAPDPQAADVLVRQTEAADPQAGLGGGMAPTTGEDPAVAAPASLDAADPGVVAEPAPKRRGRKPATPATPATPAPFDAPATPSAPNGVPLL